MAKFFDLDPVWATSVALTESSLGLNQVSPTGCKGVFQMSSMAMFDLTAEMAIKNEDLVDIACGMAFLYLLLKRHKSIKKATEHFCDPKDKKMYLKRVKKYMKELSNE